MNSPLLVEGVRFERDILVTDPDAVEAGQLVLRDLEVPVEEVLDLHAHRFAAQAEQVIRDLHLEQHLPGQQALVGLEADREAEVFPHDRLLDDLRFQRIPDILARPVGDDGVKEAIHQHRFEPDARIHLVDGGDQGAHEERDADIPQQMVKEGILVEKAAGGTGNRTDDQQTRDDQPQRFRGDALDHPGGFLRRPRPIQHIFLGLAKLRLK